MNRLAIVYLSMAAVLTAGGLIGCKARQTPQQPATTFVSEVVGKLGKSGQACFDHGDQELCVAKAARPLGVGDTLEPQQELVLCTRVAGQLSDCRNMRAEPELGIEYVCDDGTCYCEGVANCMLLAADCRGGGTCGECAIGDCCCPQSSIVAADLGPIDQMP
ncbi:MAG TPA: hypothetical protein VK034_19895 [Enhygromyxa sp.]|nr:hypothetical protein [Enhygromyxa sp.]